MRPFCKGTSVECRVLAIEKQVIFLRHGSELRLPAADGFEMLILGHYQRLRGLEGRKEIPLMRATTEVDWHGNVLV